MMNLFNLATCALDYFIAYEFTGNFLKHRDKSGIKKTALILILSSLLFFVNLLNQTWLNPIAFCLITFTINLLLFCGSSSTKMTLAVFFTVLSNASEVLSTFALALILQSNVLITLSFVHNQIVAKSVSIFILWGIIKAIKFSYPKSNYKASKLKANALLILPLSSIVILLFFLYFDKWIPATFEHAFLACFICVLLGAVNLIVFNVYDDQMKSAELKAQLLNAKLAQEKTEEYYRAQEQYLQNTHALTHDFKNHLVAIRALTGNDDQLSEYVDQISGRLAESSKGITDYTDNKVINVILHQKQQICIENHIELTIKCNYSLLNFIQYPDACSIFGNALDNAIAACLLQAGTQRYINLNIYSHNETLVVEFENSRNPSIKLLEDGKSMFRTTKQQPQLHGYGLINIKEAVVAYHGRVIFNYTENTFNVTLFIPLNQK